MVYVTGDCHGDFGRFSKKAFPEQKDLSRDDIVIVCGDFGLWEDDANERYWLDWLSEKPFFITFVDGNHENFDRIYSNEFEVSDFCGGKVHKIRDNVLHLMRGHIFTFDNNKFFCMGGASSHDIRDGIFDTDNYSGAEEAIAEYEKWVSQGRQFRVNHLSWWKEEMPSKSEIDFGMESLERCNYEVDYVISHCLPQSVASTAGYMSPDPLTNYFDHLIYNGLSFKRWYCGHYHTERSIWGKFIIKYWNFERVI